jgi:hypothetical protein
MRLIGFLLFALVAIACKQSVQHTTDCTPPFRSLDVKANRVSLTPEILTLNNSDSTDQDTTRSQIMRIRDKRNVKN